MVCHAVTREDRRAKRVRKTGGPCLLPLEDVSDRMDGSTKVLTEVGTGTRMRRQQRLVSCGTGPKAGPGRGLSCRFLYLT